MKTLAKRQLFAWLACCAILLNALVPAVSHAFAASQPPEHTWQICLNDGTLLSGVGQLDRETFLRLTDRSRSPAAVHGGGHGDAHPADFMADCAYCLPHAGSVGLPPSPGFALPGAALAADKPFLFYHAPRPLQAWTAAQPRGPPRLA